MPDTDNMHNFSRRAEEIDNFLLQANPSHAAQIESASDPALSYNIQRYNLSVSGDLRFGRVIMSLPFANWYRVSIENANGELPCVKIGDNGGYRLIGARDASNITPDTKVLVLVPKTASYGFILGIAPELTEDGNHEFSDWISQGSNVGILKDRYYSEYLRLLGDEGGAAIHSGGSPLDSLSLDWTQTTETGVSFHLDPFMAYMRVDEECGIFGFYQDRTVRIAANNLELITCCRVEHDYIDEGELSGFKGIAVYTWENYGAYSFDTPISKEIPDADVLHNKPYSALEPLVTDLQPFYRYQEYSGYLGQPLIKFVVIPPTDSKIVGIRAFSDTSSDLGVFKEQISLDGTYTVESAKCIRLIKRGIIAVPRRLKESTDYSKDGDTNDNYKFAGKFGDGKEPVIKDLNNTEEYRSVFSAVAALDYCAYDINWKNLHTFHYHNKDFNLPEDSDLNDKKYLPDFSELERYPYLTTPKPVEHKVDDRLDNVKYWQLMQHITLTDDGCIVIQAGQGEEIRLGGGCIQISAPGKILIQSGNTTAILAGDDFIAKAYNSADITTSKKDIRLKAENNMMLMSGNSGKGTLLLENRSTGNNHTYPDEGGEKVEGSGIIIKSKGQAAIISPDIYIRSIDYGNILIDSDNGKGLVTVVAGAIKNMVSDNIIDSFGYPEPTGVNVYSRFNTIINGSLGVDGQLLVNGSGLFKNSIYSTHGHFSSIVGGQTTRIVNRAELDLSLTNMEEDKKELIKNSKEFYVEQIDNKYYKEDKIGNEVTLTRISFGLRSDFQYGTTKFVLPQNNWQVINNVVNAGTTWDETTVMYQGKIKQQPWPGYLAWSVDSNFLTLPPDQLKFYDVATGMPKDRDTGVYETDDVGRFTRLKIDSNYSILPSV